MQVVGGGLTTVAAFSLGAVISNQWQTGVLAAFFVTLIGNLAGLREWFARPSVNFDYFWATSRVVKDTINEMISNLKEQTLKNALHTYFMKYRFAHPTQEDFMRTVNEVAGRDLGWYWQQAVYGT